MLDETSHRPWPVPSRPWSIFMRWLDLAFIHWPIAPAQLRPLIPPQLELDLFDNTAWIGIVPFHMIGIRHRYLFPFPGTSAFAELNVRTYVTHKGKQGVWFFSLDATNLLAIEVARRTFHLPYFHARISRPPIPGRINFGSFRTSSAASFQAHYWPQSDIPRARPGSLEHFLTERYCLYCTDHTGELWRGDIHHKPWPLHRAHVRIDINTMLQPLGLAAPSDRPLVHYSPAIDALVWRIIKVESPAAQMS